MPMHIIIIFFLQKIGIRECECAALRKELGIFIGEEYRGSNLQSNLTIHELDLKLRDDVLRLKSIREERLKDLAELKTADEEVCAKLGLESMDVSTKVVPTQEQMAALKKHVEDMKVYVFPFKMCHHRFY